MATKDLIRRTQFEHIVSYPILKSITDKVKEIESFYGDNLTKEGLMIDFCEGIKPNVDNPFDPLEIAALAIAIAKLNHAPR